MKVMQDSLLKMNLNFDPGCGDSPKELKSKELCDMMLARLLSSTADVIDGVGMLPRWKSGNDVAYSDRGTRRRLLG